MKNCKNIILGIILVLVGVWFGLYATGVVKVNLLLMVGGHYLSLFQVFLVYLMKMVELAH